MRIISGHYRGRRIKRVKDHETRETADMVRESVFNMLGPVDGVVLDLFAGSGAYGLEALSRGATWVFLVDSSRSAVKTMVENVSILNVSNRVSIKKSDYRDFLRRLKDDQRFDCVFIDPPYDLYSYEDVIGRLIPYLSEKARLVLESKKETKIDSPDVSLHKEKEKTYGNKRITIYQKG